MPGSVERTLRQLKWQLDVRDKSFYSSVLGTMACLSFGISLLATSVLGTLGCSGRWLVVFSGNERFKGQVKAALLLRRVQNCACALYGSAGGSRRLPESRLVWRSGNRRRVTQIQARKVKRPGAGPARKPWSDKEMGASDEARGLVVWKRGFFFF